MGVREGTDAMKKTLGALVLVALAVAAVATLIACGGGGPQVALVAYSTPREAYAELILAFQKTAAGANVEFSESYGSSGEQSRAVEAGLPADVVEFSLAPDMTRLVTANLVDKTWDQNQYDGFVTKSVVVLVVRKGNPKGIKTWADLTKPDVEVIEPNPFTSGGAKWNIMAAYGAQLKQGKTAQEAEAYLAELFKHVPVQDKSAREALQTFIGGKGDVLLSYENEAIAAQQAGEAVDYVVPAETILIENPLAVTADASSAPESKAFYDYLYTPAAQAIFVSKGYRPVVDGIPGAAKFPTPTKLFTIDDLGGWDKVNKDFFDPTASVMATVEQGLGISTQQ
ncbi:MAG TPA: sulfate ABC transporter substrate-binding protein [Solirubrobacterales bacterium]|nr:sulfate ABC transporter substrate-binding protein [Solirubrobacterales bacterium]